MMEQERQSGFVESLEYIKANHEIPYYWSMGPNGPRTLLKRAVRRLVKCILFPILEKQNLLNAHIAHCLDQMFLFAQTEQEQGAVLQKEVDILREKLVEQDTARRQELDALHSQLAEQEQRLNTWQAAFDEFRTSNMEQINNAHEKLGKLSQKSEKSAHCLEQQVKALEAQQSISSREFGRAQALLERLQLEGVLPVTDGGSRLIRQFVSQSGEDMILANILAVLGLRESKCSYLDLGANHARELSNTYYFYQRGARGVLVEANPDLIGELKFYRSEDVVLNRCVTAQSGQSVAFYILNGDGLSTPDKEQAEDAVKQNPALSFERTVMVETITVNEIMDTYFDKAPVYLNIDIEGEEMKILESIDFESHRPMIISVEMIPYRPYLVVGSKNQDILDFMDRNDYVEYAFTGINSIFLDKRQIKEALRDRASIGELLSDQDFVLDCMPYVCTNEFAEHTGSSVNIFPGGISYGPYFSLYQGTYQLNITLALSGGLQTLNVTTDKGTQRLEEFALSDGSHTVFFELAVPANEVEFVLKNETGQTIILSELTLRQADAQKTE